MIGALTLAVMALAVLIGRIKIQPTKGSERAHYRKQNRQALIADVEKDIAALNPTPAPEPAIVFVQEDDGSADLGSSNFDVAKWSKLMTCGDRLICSSLQCAHTKTLSPPQHIAIKMPLERGSVGRAFWAEPGTVF